VGNNGSLSFLNFSSFGNSIGETVFALSLFLGLGSLGKSSNNISLLYSFLLNSLILPSGPITKDLLFLCLKASLLSLGIVVLSNNDGCAIARSNEAKALGIPMGAPAFDIL
jgi:hypothetical protein